MPRETAAAASTPTRRRTAARHRREWWIPAGLIALTLIPVLAGSVRLAELAGGEANPDNQRFFDSPVPVMVHIVAATVFCVLGAFQFMPSLRRHRPWWHRGSGRVVMVAGLAAALSGLWMSVLYDLPEHDNRLLMVIRLVFGTLMAAGIVIAYVAIRARDVRRHQLWIARAYAVGQGAGTQAVIMGPLLLVLGEMGADEKAAGMFAGWAINVVVADWLVRRSWARRSHPGQSSRPV